MGIDAANADDAPGAAVIRFLLTLAAVLFGVKTARNRLTTLPGCTALAVCSHGRVRGISHASGHGSAVGQRVGTLATRAVTNALPHRRIVRRCSGSGPTVHSSESGAHSRSERLADDAGQLDWQLWVPQPPECDRFPRARITERRHAVTS
jgi:hypothetical protein